MRRKFLKLGVIILGVALVLGLALPGFVAADNARQGQKQEQRQKNDQQAEKSVRLALHIVGGEVIAIATDGTSFEVKSGEKPAVTVNVDENTRYFQVTQPHQIPPGLEKIREEIQKRMGKGPREGKGPDIELVRPSEFAVQALNKLDVLRKHASEAAFADIEVGQKVFALVNADNLARDVLIIIAPAIARVHGTISAVGADSITITKADSTTVVLKWNADTRFVLNGAISVAVGQTANAAYNTDTMEAKVVLIKAPEVTPSATTTSVST